MNDLAIHAEGLGKLYHIGRTRHRTTLGEALVAAATSPLRNLARSLRATSRPADPPTHLWALRDVDLDVRRGEAVGIIGRNGAGKSTLLRILARITVPTTGRAILRGRLSSLLEVGTGFNPELTGRDNIYLNGVILGMKKAEVKRKFDEIVAFSEIEKFINTPVKYYSSGMSVRLAFAVAAHLDPEILIIDEVLAVGDAGFQKKCMGKMNDVTTQEGRTILFVSHNMGAITRLCPRAILLEEGRIVKEGSAREVVETYYESFRMSNGIATDGSRRYTGDMGFVKWSVAPFHEPVCHEQFTQKPCDLRFLLGVKKPICQAYFGVAMYATDGQLIWSMRSEDQSDGYVDLPAGEHEVHFHLPALPLRPGQFRLQVSANTQLKQHDLWDADPPLTILQRNESGLPPVWQGILNLPGQFEIKTLNDSRSWQEEAL